MAITRMTSRIDSGPTARGLLVTGAQACARRGFSAKAAAIALILGVSAGPAVIAQTWTIDPSIGVSGTATNNVNLDPSDQREGDFVTQITPTLVVSERGTRTNLVGFISLPVVLYARTGSENNKVYPSVNLLGTVQPVRDFFFVEGSVSVAQQFFNPFGPQPDGLTNATRNRYRSDTYRLSPYIKGVTPGNINYELRNDNVWTNLSGAPINADEARYTRFFASASNTAQELGWRADLDYNDTKFNEQNSIITRLGRFAPVYAVTPQTRLAASVGYEDNTYQISSSRGAIYGVGIEWNPTPRTKVLGYWEHRFFGSSYRASINHRTPLSIWSIQASRDISTYPQQLATVPGGVDVSAFLNGLYSSITDPVDRQRTVDEIIQNRGLPSTLGGPVPLYAQQILLQQRASATAGLIGARNSILLTIFNLRSEPILGSGTPLPPELAGGNDNTQTGASLVWTHNLAPTIILVGSVNASRTVANSGLDFSTRQGSAQALLSYSATRRTSVFGGVRYQESSTEFGLSDYSEAAVFAGIRHNFK